MNEEDAQKYIIHWLRDPPNSKHTPQSEPMTSYGYGVYLPNIMRSYVKSQEKLNNSEVEQRITGLYPYFCDAAWGLCRRGILRPGVKESRGQVTDDGSGGNGYSITSFGRTWIAESDRDDFVPTEPERFGEMLKPYQTRFGPGFYERSQEALRCYNARAYLACCAMCGAAAESILLAVAIEKKSEEEVLKVYGSAGGRGRVENIVIGQTRQQVQREFRGFTALLKYWRDEAAHGKASGIQDNEAYISLMSLLLRFVKYVDDHWDELVKENIAEVKAKQK